MVLCHLSRRSPNGILQGSVLGSVQFNIFFFIADLAKGIVSIFKFTWAGRDDTVRIQIDLDRLQHWFECNKMKFSRDECQVLLLGSENKFYKVNEAWLDSSWENIWHIWGFCWTKSSVGTNSVMWQLKSSWLILRGIASRNKEVHLYSGLLRPYMEYYVQFWMP